jgi:5-methylcytosine-specific restriction protein A
MAIPGRELIKSNLLEFLRSHGPSTASDAYEHLAEKLALSSTDIEKTRSNGRSLFHHEVRWAKQELVLDGLVCPRGATDWNVWQLVTEREQGVMPEEIPNFSNWSEGSAKTIVVNKYERSNKARKKCIDFHGAKCLVCEFDFSATYGTIGIGCIHVHHLLPLASIGKRYRVNPVSDLRPVCPNCHYMLHRKEPPYSIEEMRLIIKRSTHKR